MATTAENLEQRLNVFDPDQRREALETLAAGAESLPPQGACFNLHCRRFYSYNGYGLSPSGLAWTGRKHGLYAMGLVDFDVLDGVDEFLAACYRLGLRACAGLETRIYIPEFSGRVINSPGEPGIAYHMGAGFTATAAQDGALPEHLKAQAQARNQGLVERVNRHLSPVELDYDADVLPLTPNGNPTERHVCAAYQTKAEARFPDDRERARFWAHRLGLAEEQVAGVLHDSPKLQGLIRAKTMKRGGVGYVAPDAGGFPRLEVVNRFTREAGGIPTMTWLDGTSDGEQAIDELLDVMMASGVAALNIIPDRNWNISDPAVKKTKVARLHEIVAKCRERHLPIIVGTEMNAYGQRIVDDFEAPEMAPLFDAFREGCHVLHAHTLLQAHAGMGYTSPWADRHFDDTEGKNRFYAAFGAAVPGPHHPVLTSLRHDATPGALLAQLSSR